MNRQRIDVEAFIRSRARMDWSRAMVAGALDVPASRLNVMLEHVPGVRWPERGHSAACKRSYEQRRGVSTEKLRSAAVKARATRIANLPHYTIGEHTGNRHELYRVWEDLCSVAYSTACRRLARGMSVLDAFFKPDETHKGWGVNKNWGKAPGWLMEARDRNDYRSK